MPERARRIVNLDLDLLRAFVAVAETRSFTRAGHRLGRSQSAISLQLKRLEDRLDACLLSRDPRHVALTAEGETVLGQARRLLRLNDEIVAGLHQGDLEGEVRFGAPEDFATAHLPDVLGRYTQAHPRVQLNVTCDFTVNLMEQLSGGALDLALIKREPMGPDLGVRVWREPLVWVAASPEVLERDGPLALVLAPHPDVYRRRALAALEQAGRPWRVAYTSPSLAGQQAALRAGLGVTVLPREMVPPDLHVLPASELPPLPDTELALLRARATLPRAAERLAEFVLSALDRQRLDAA